MKTDNISMQQILSLLSAALLSPLILLLPGETVVAGGRAGWLSALAALPVTLMAGWAFRKLVEGAPEETGLAGGLELAFGRWAIWCGGCCCWDGTPAGARFAFWPLRTAIRR